MEATLGHVNIVGRSFELNNESRNFIRRRIEARIAKFRGAVRAVEVRITDLNGPKGGEDKSCSVVATLQTGEALVARTKGTNMQSALAEAVGILGRQVAKTLRRGRWQRPRRAG